LDLAPGGVCHAPDVTIGAVRSYRPLLALGIPLGTPFHLCLPTFRVEVGRIFSVALSLPPDVTSGDGGG